MPARFVYSSVHLPDLEAYIKTNLSAGLRPASIKIQEVSVVDGGNSIKYKTQAWVINNKRIYAQAYYSIRGNQYQESKKPLDFEIFILDQMSTATPLSSKNIGDYFVVNDKDLNFKRITLAVGGDVDEAYIPDSQFGDALGTWYLGSTNSPLPVIYTCRIFQYSVDYKYQSCFSVHK